MILRAYKALRRASARATESVARHPLVGAIRFACRLYGFRCGSPHYDDDGDMKYRKLIP